MVQILKLFARENFYGSICYISEVVSNPCVLSLKLNKRCKLWTLLTGSLFQNRILSLENSRNQGAFHREPYREILARTLRNLKEKEVSILWSYLDIILLFSCYVYLIFFQIWKRFSLQTYDPSINDTNNGSLFGDSCDLKTEILGNILVQLPNVRTQDPENFYEEVKSLVTAC